MERNNVLGMIVGYYLSRVDQRAYAQLGHDSQQATHRALGEALGVPANSIENWRDEFDPVHDNRRKGWHKREMYASRKRAIEALADLSDHELGALVQSMLDNPESPALDEVVQAVTAVESATDETKLTICLRGPTGHKAEEAFREEHEKTGWPLSGQLRDRRYDECGYDFQLEVADRIVAIEVKGLAGVSGGITFTDKEWSTAQEMGEDYFLVIVRNVATEPQFSVIRNPRTVLNPEFRAYTTVQIGWSVGHPALHAAESDDAS